MDRRFAIELMAAVAVAGAAFADAAVPEWQATARRDFADRRFGIFVHWGIYAMYAQGEWYQLQSKAKREVYAQAMHGFCPAAFDAGKWVAAFKDAGAKYVTFTSRHHDGFSMFESRFSGGYDILHTPFGRDVCKELADACHAADVQINFYYSLMDWWRTDYPIGEYSKGLGDAAANANSSYDTYRRFMLDQLGELLSEKYAPVGCIWMDGEGDHFDGCANALPNGWGFDSIYDFIHSRGALVGNNNNRPTREKEDVQFFEMTKSAGIAGAKATGNGKPFERCSTMQKHVWGYKLTGEFHTPEEMIALLVRNAAKDVNLLLNVGPRADGDLPPEAYAILKAMGVWMRRNGESVYATDAGEVSAGDGIVSTSGRDGTLYLHFVDPALRSFAFRPPRSIASAVCLASGKAEKVETTPSGDAVVTIAREPDDSFDHVVKVTFVPDWQALIDEAAAKGGGRVTVPPGRHVTGGLVLRDNVELHLEQGAVLEGSPRTNDYPVVELPCSEGKWMAVVMAVGATNVSVTGKGEIHGNGTAFPQPANYANLQEGWRPRGLFFGNCTGVRLKDFKLRDSGSWGCVVQCCRDVEIRGLAIDNHANANNDGIDIEAFNAVIADCDIDAGDDGVCLKSNNPDFVSGNVLVTNVTVRSHCAALKIGTATHGIVTNVTFVACRIEAPRRDFPDRRAGKGKPEGAGWFWSKMRAEVFPPSGPGDDLSLSAISVECVDGGWVENVVCRNITVDGTLAPIFVRGGTRTGRPTGARPGRWHVLRNVLFENITGRSRSWYGNSVTGVGGCRVQGVTLRKIRLTYPGGGEAAGAAVKPIPEMPGAGPGTIMFKTTLPASALWARHVDGLVLDDVRIEPESGTTDAREKYVFEDVTELADFKL